MVLSFLLGLSVVVIIAQHIKIEALEDVVRKEKRDVALMTDLKNFYKDINKKES